MTRMGAKTGGCLCGGVKYLLTAPLTDVVYCHCGQCRRTSGHYIAATNVPENAFELVNEETLCWYQASDIARRGFCGRCGSNLFWDPLAEARISVWAGTIDAPTGLKAKEHIYTDDQGDYYEICDGLPQFGGNS